MTDRHRTTRILIFHFLRRFFDNDSLQADDDTQTSVVRALSVVAVPGLMISFFLQIVYRPVPFQRPTWNVIEDHYFFVLFSFVVMGMVALFEWEMLFPDRLDFLVLSPLPLKAGQLLTAKATALVAFCSMFVVSCNVFGTWVLPAVSRLDFYRQVYAHAAAVLMAGMFAFFVVIAMGGVLLCVFGADRVRAISPAIQMFSVTALVLMMLQYGRYCDLIPALLSEQMPVTRLIPPFWFLGLYEHLLHGKEAASFAGDMSNYAIRGTVIAAAVAFGTYPLAWARMRRMSIEGESRSHRVPSRLWTYLVRHVVRQPEERAVFSFIGQTIARNNRYPVYLAMYLGTGLALGIACATRFNVVLRSVKPELSDWGLHAIIPLLLFWVIAGLRTAFAFPLNLPAGWVFRLTGVTARACARAAWKWASLCAMCVMCCVLVTLGAAAWDARHLFVQAVCGTCLSVLLVDGFFLFQRSVPFNKPRMQGRTSLPLLLTLYIGVLPPFLFLVIAFEKLMEKRISYLVLVAVATTCFHMALRSLQGESEEIEEEMEGYEGEIQLLGLSLRR